MGVDLQVPLSTEPAAVLDRAAFLLESEGFDVERPSADRREAEPQRPEHDLSRYNP
ncbi:MAG: hypothetical protein H6739_37705 [Alphaproteobacteria bacterium]|nr:hypothetical protein [Alphaproteobacteria bacterium]